MREDVLVTVPKMGTEDVKIDTGEERGCEASTGVQRWSASWELCVQESWFVILYCMVSGVFYHVWGSLARKLSERSLSRLESAMMQVTTQLVQLIPASVVHGLWGEADAALEVQ